MSEPQPIARELPMELVELPLIDIDAPLSAALAALQKFHRSAVIVADRNLSHYLLHAVDIYKGRAEQKMTLADLMPGIQEETSGLLTRILPFFEVQSGAHTEFSALGSKMDETNAIYAVIRKIADTAVLAIRSESLAALIRSGPADCYCTGARQHSFPPPDVETGDVCPYDGSAIYCNV